MIQTVLLFFVMMWAFGFSIAKLVKVREDENMISRNLLRLGFGISVFPILSIILNLFRIPLVWWLFLGLSLIIPLIYAFKGKQKDDKNKEKKDSKLSSLSPTIAIVLLISIILFSVYLRGAFGYSYLEDDDPWRHATGAVYVAEHKTFSMFIGEEITNENFFRTYLEPYPPAYDTLMGVLHQTNDDIKWTLKFFNVLLIALGLIFFYFFAKEFTKSEKKALFATFVLATLPCFMSHFIWAQTLAIVLFFPAFYCLEKIDGEKNSRGYAIIAAIVVAGIFVSQPSTPVFFAIMAGLYCFGKIIACYFNKEKIISEKNIVIVLALIAGVIFSMVYWVPTLVKYGPDLTKSGIGLNTELFTPGSNIDTSGGIVYGIKDYMIAPLVSKMDQPIGIGLVVFLLVLFSLVILSFNIKKIKASHYLLTVLIWLIFTFIGTEGNALPFKLFPHRFWAFLAIPVAFLVAEIIVSISASLKDKSLKYAFILLIIAGILWTSAYPKYVVETSAWPPGVSWSANEELQGYTWLETNMPKDTRMFNPCSGEGKLLAFGMYSPPFDTELFWFKTKIANKTLEDITNITRNHDLDYVVIEGYCANKIGINQTNDLLKQMANSTNYQLTYSTPAFWLFKLK